MNGFMKAMLLITAIGCSITIILLPIGAIIYGEYFIIEELEKLNKRDKE